MVFVRSFYYFVYEKLFFGGRFLCFFGSIYGEVGGVGMGFVFFLVVFFEVIWVFWESDVFEFDTYFFLRSI